MQSIGNLARHMMSQHQNARLQSDFLKLSKEVASGQASDIPKKLSGDLAGFSDHHRTLSKLESFRLANSETAVLFDAAATSLETLSGLQSGLMEVLTAGANTTSDAVARTVTAEANSALRAAVDVLNISVAGRSVFSGNAFGDKPLKSVEDILESLKTAVIGAATSGDFLQAIDDWFNTPGVGFLGEIYQGSEEPSSLVQVSENIGVQHGLKADHPDVRNALRDFAAIALLQDEDLNIAPATQNHIIGEVATRSHRTKSALVALSAEVGVAQSYLETATAENEAANAAVQMALSDSTSVDPYETAVRFEAVHSQIEALYLTTVRLNNLSLMDYMR